MDATPIGIDAEAYRLMRVGRLREALALAERAVGGARECLPGHAFLASILRTLGRTNDARSVVNAAAGLPAAAASAYDDLAYVSLQLGGHELANTLYRRATELSPNTPRFWYNLACSERSLGALVQAERACDRCLALDPAHYATYSLRSELRVQAPDVNHIAELQARLALTTDRRARVLLGYALAKELDDVQRFDEAFRWFKESAAARRSQFSYDVASDEHTLRLIARSYARSPPAASHQPQGVGCIFIVGLPRSGTTLVERILTGLDGVQSNGETENFAGALMASIRETRDDVVARAAAADPGAVAARYVRLSGCNGGGAQVIEKLPTNYLYAGAIRRALPHAKFVLVRRSPLDSCFAMYRTLFGEAFPFSYDFGELARYYAAYDALMTHWRSVLGDWFHEVVYEDLVAQPKLVGAAIADYCGLAWTGAALDIQNNKSASLTASAAQIRRPIYGSSSGRWRHYRQHLMPLIAALGERGIDLADDA